jgi:hypothetical protein
MVKTIIRKKYLTDIDIKKIEGVLLNESYYDLLINFDCDLYNEDGELLAKFRKKVIDKTLIINSFDILNFMSLTGLKNRGNAIDKKITKINTVRKSDGSIYKSKTSCIYVHKVESLKKYDSDSGLLGYFDRVPRYPYCRQTAFNLNNPEKFQKIYPLIKKVSDLFKENVPDRYEKQKNIVDKTSKDFVIKDTAFTTITVNKNWQTACHTDRGDFEEGFGNLTVIESGNHYNGAYFVFPRYRVAFDVRTGDICFANVHEWHGNTAFVAKKGSKF